MADDKSGESRQGSSDESGKSDDKSAKPTGKSGKTATKTAKQSAHTDHRTGPVTFYRQVVAELRKVVWPTREQLVTYFFVVMAFVLVMIAIVSLLDLGFGKLVFEIFGGADDV